MSQDVFTKLVTLVNEIEEVEIGDADELEKFRIRYLGSKNILKPLSSEIRNVPPDRRKEFGILVNKIKSLAQDKFSTTQRHLQNGRSDDERTDLDLTAPPREPFVGSIHPVSLVMNKIVDIFAQIGFSVAEDREIEDDWHNFTALNTPEHHPARDMQDTFYLKDSHDLLLRTHTSSVQSRLMTSQRPPIRIVAPGRVFRNETISARSHCQFHQVEGLYVDKGVSFADMKQTLMLYARAMYGPEAVIRLRPSYFPFTEPSAEMDVYWGLNSERDYRITKGTGWLEILGCGMVDPNVLENCGIDPEIYTGFAFGMGIERQAMLQYRVGDIRMFFENDTRFLKQFRSAK